MQDRDDTGNRSNDWRSSQGSIRWKTTARHDQTKDLSMMERITTHVPPVLRERDGKWFVVLSTGSIEVEAPIGSQFVEQLLERVAFPRMRKALQVER
jgi:hypothetical protein